MGLFSKLFGSKAYKPKQPTLDVGLKAERRIISPPPAKSNQYKIIVEHLGCDYVLFEKEKDGEKIFNTWKELSEQGKKEGFFPLIIVCDDLICEMFEFAAEDYGTREQILQEAQTLDVSKLFEKWYNERAADADSGEEIVDFGEFIECDPSDSFTSCTDFNGRPHSAVIIAKIPAKNPWELAAWVPVGACNYDQSPLEHIAVFKYWYEKYGAVPGLVTFEVWEMFATKPPTTDETSEVLAWEQFKFCPDIVEQGVGTLRALASSLKNSSCWYFWWD